MAFNLNSASFGLEKKPTPQENAEIENLNRSKDYDIHDPYHNPLEGIKDYEHELGFDVDSENYYHPGFEGFEDEVETPNNPIDDSEKGGEVGAFMEKYNLEEFELEKLMADCEAYQNGKNILAPLRDSHDLGELALLYRDYEGAKHDGLPFNDEELSKISEDDRENLIGLYEKKSGLVFKIAENNSLINGLKTEGEPLVAKVDHAYSTAWTEKISEKKGATLTLRPEIIAKRTDEIKKQIDEIKKQIDELETPIYKKVLKVDRELEERAQDARNDARNNDPKLWKDVPKYSEADLALQKNVLAYIRQEEGAKKPVSLSGEKLTREQIEDVLRDIAEDEKWPKANFFAEARKINRNGHEQEIRQLATVENLSNSRRAKYTFVSDNLPVGQYFYQADLKSAVISKTNPNLAFAPINLFISAERSKKNVPEAVADRMAEVASEKIADKPMSIIRKRMSENKVRPTIIKKETSAEVIDKPKPIIIKKEIPQDKPASTIIKKESPVEKPAPVIKKRVPEEVM